MYMALHFVVLCVGGCCAGLHMPCLGGLVHCGMEPGASVGFGAGSL